MNTGIFFSLNKKFSRPNQGIIYYNYRAIINEIYDTENPVSHLKYPIYASISRHEISFYFHLTVNDEQDEKVSHEQLNIEHTNSPILTLSIDTATTDQESLHKNLLDTQRETIDLSKYKLKVKEIEGRPSIMKQLTYSNSEEFKDFTPECFPLKKLLLDFLYDAEHTHVFLSSAYFIPLYSRLCDNFLFKAIRNKAEYYYQRNLLSASIKHPDHQILCYKTRAKEVCEKIVNFLKNTKTTMQETARRVIEFIRLKIASLFAKRNTENETTSKACFLHLAAYVEAERRWVDTITDPRADRVFEFSAGWMRNPTDELDSTYGKPFMQSSSTLSTSHAYHKLCSSRKIKQEINRNIQKKSDIQASRIADTANRSLLWYLSKYDIAGFYMIVTGRFASVFSWIHIILLMSYGFVICSLCMSDPEWLQTYLGDSNGLFPLIAAFPILFPVAIYIVIQLLKRKTFSKITLLNISYVRLIAAITAAWIPFSIDGTIVSTFFDKEDYIIMFSILLFVTILFLFHEVSKRNPYLGRWRRLFNTGYFALIAFFYSTIIGIISMTYFASSYLQSNDKLEHFVEARVFDEQTKTYTYDKADQNFVSYVKNQSADESEAGNSAVKQYNKTVNYFNLLCGLNPIENKARNAIVTEVSLPLGGKSVRIFNNMLISFSLFAMFVGIFLQSFIVEKSTSDPV